MAHSHFDNQTPFVPGQVLLTLGAADGQDVFTDSDRPALRAIAEIYVRSQWGLHKPPDDNFDPTGLVISIHWMRDILLIGARARIRMTIEQANGVPVSNTDLLVLLQWLNTGFDPDEIIPKDITVGLIIGFLGSQNIFSVGPAPLNEALLGGMRLPGVFVPDVRAPGHLPSLVTPGEILPPEIAPADKLRVLARAYPGITNTYASGRPNAPPDSGTGGGPACRPRRVLQGPPPSVGNPAATGVQDKDWQFTLPPDLQTPTAEGDAKTPLVFILDTVPPPDALSVKLMNTLQNEVATYDGARGTDFSNSNAAPPQAPPFGDMVFSLTQVAANQQTTRTSLLARLLTGFTTGTASGSFIPSAQSTVLDIVYNEDLHGTVPPDQHEGDVRVVRRVDGDPNREYPYFAMDHGLFIAGIIHSLAPEIEDSKGDNPHNKLHWYEVLNAYAFGTINTLQWGLAEITTHVNELGRAGEANGKQVIVNVSLTIEDEYLDELQQSIVTIAADAHAMLLAELGRQLEDEFMVGIETLTGAKPIIVAAAGNEGDASTVPPTHPPARYPAAFAFVVGVAALDRPQPNPSPNSPLGRQLEEYSNLPYDAAFNPTSNLPPESSFAVIGGQTGGPPASAPAAATVNLDYMAHPSQGLLGAYIGAFPPQRDVNNPPPASKPQSWQFSLTQGHGVANESRGWARWAGTSFATAIITGTLAHLCVNAVSDPLSILNHPSHILDVGSGPNSIYVRAFPGITQG